MCFSAGASFGAGVVLSVIGVVTIRKAKTKSQTVFAGIPLIFAVQQVTEGFLWLALSKREFEFLQNPATYIFLFFAQVVWPFYIPLAVTLLEKNANRKKLQAIFVGIGAVLALYLAYCLGSSAVSADIIGRHVHYNYSYPAAFNKYCGPVYIVATIIPAFISSVKRMWWFGGTIAISYIITAIFYHDHVVSVWCFFASVISVVVLAIISKLKYNQVISEHPHPYAV